MSENLVRQAEEQARQHAHEYAAGAERPLKGYVGALGVFGGAVAGAVAAARALSRPAPRLSGRDTRTDRSAVHRRCAGHRAPRTSSASSEGALVPW
ncbi:hypothetical protein ACFV3R_23365 [Streptomyces sp. NPDC059740]|uniref:hypothetical protein n=1 Tax=Streptomyces sp. NPDC059740 TaxID=3346926 RepID=UPI00364C57F6